MKRARIGLLGCGRMGYHHGANMAFYCPNIELAGVYDPDPAAATRAAQDFSAPLFESEDALLQSDKLDGVVIVSGADMHCTHIKKAMAAGKHTFIEKPVSTKLSELPEIYAAVKERPELVFQVGYYKRYDPEYRYAYQKLREGVIGRPTMIKLMNRDPEAPPKEFMPGCAGIFLDLAVHELDAMRWFAGCDPATFYTTGGVYRYDFMAEFGDLDTAAISVEMENGMLALIDLSRNAVYGNHIESEIFGTEGDIRVGRIDKNSCEIYADKKRYHETGPWFLERNAQAYLTELREFAAHITDGTKPEATVTDAVRATQMAIAARQSYESRSAVRFDDQGLK